MCLECLARTEAQASCQLLLWGESPLKELLSSQVEGKACSRRYREKGCVSASPSSWQVVESYLTLLFGHSFKTCFSELLPCASSVGKEGIVTGCFLRSSWSAGGNRWLSKWVSYSLGGRPGWGTQEAGNSSCWPDEDCQATPEEMPNTWSKSWRKPGWPDLPVAHWPVSPWGLPSSSVCVERGWGQHVQGSRERPHVGLLGELSFGISAIY